MGLGAFHFLENLFENFQNLAESKANDPKSNDLPNSLTVVELFPELVQTDEFRNSLQRLQNKAQKLGIGFQTLEFSKLLETLRLESKTRTILLHPNYKKYFPTLLSELESAIDAQNPSLHKSINQSTVQTFQKVWTHNYFRNLERYRKGSEYILPVIKPVPLSFEGIILVGASPSLETELEKLQQLSKANILLSSDTASRFLIKNGIAVDGVVSIDSGRGTGFHISHLAHSSIPRFTWLGGNTQFQESNHVQYFFTSHPLDQILAHLSGISYLENPSQNILGLAGFFQKNWKLPKACLAGFSLVQQGSKSHCVGTGYELYRQQTINRTLTIESYNKLGYGRQRLGKNQLAWEHLSKFPQMENVVMTTFSLSFESSPPKIPKPDWVKIQIPEFKELLASDSFPGVDALRLKKYLAFG